MALARHQFPPAIAQHAVGLYVRCTLSYRDVEDLLVELPLQEQLGESSRTRKGEILELDERLTPKPSSSRVSSRWKSRVKSQRKSTRTAVIV
jgi:transposase-like protein